MKNRIDNGETIFDGKMKASFYKRGNVYVIMRLFDRVIETMFFDEAERYWNKHFQER